MPYSLTLPDGTVVNNIPDNVTRAQALDNLKVKVPDAFPAPQGLVSNFLVFQQRLARDSFVD
jgi:hypothetical protein